MKIVFCTKGDRMLPSSRTRAHLIADYLRTQGYDACSYHIKTRPWWNLSWERVCDIPKNWRLIMSVGKGDILYLHKMTDQLDFMFLVLIRKWIFGRKYIFDFDDAIFLPTWNRALKARLMVSNAQAVIVGSHYLAEYAIQYNKNTHILSAPIDTDTVYQVAQNRTASNQIHIGWMGTPGHFENMKLLIKPLQKLVNEGYVLTFIQLGGGENIYELLSSINGLHVKFEAELPWDQPAQITPYVQQFDIGVMPLQKTQVNRGKDSWKAKEYMGCGVATVLSNWGENPYVVTSEVNGVLVDTEEDWYTALKKLITDAIYRKKIAQAGRKLMEDEYSYRAFLPKFLKYTGIH